jgi:C2 domain
MAHITDRVQISLHAQKLKNVAGTFNGVSDPYAVVTVVANELGQQPIILGKTEVIKHSLSPYWVTTFEADYEFSKPTRINVGVYDEAKKSRSAKPMGSAVFEIGEVLGAKGNIKAKRVKDGGTIFCRIQKAPPVDAGTFNFQFRGVKLKNVGTFTRT